MTFDEWWDKEGRDLYQRADGWLVAKAAWDAASKEVERLQHESKWGPPGGP